MSKVLVIHPEKAARKFLEARSSAYHETKAVKNLGAAMKGIATFKPDVVIADFNPKKNDALDLLRYVKRSRLELPVILVGPAGAGLLKPHAMKLGAAEFVEFPMEQAALDRAISKALQQDKDAHGDTPSITSDEQNSNLSDLEKQFNRQMVCFAGKNQVHIQSFVLGNGQTSKPRIALKCKLRQQFGQSPNVYYEYIRDVCCGDPEACPAYQEFKARHTA